MFFFQWNQDDLKHLGAIAVYMLVGIAGIVYKLVNSSDLETFLSGLADVGGAVFIVGLVTEGGIWTMVFALGRLSEERRRGREEGRAEGRKDMARAMRALGMPESEIQQALDWADMRRNGERES